MKKEKIKAAAIKRRDGVISTGKHHSEIIQSSPKGICKKGSTQGFVTNFGRFVKRKEAAEIAFNAKQIDKFEIGDILISEELWFYGGYKYSEKKGYYKN